MIARELIAEHGDTVAAYLQARIDALTEARDLAEGFSAGSKRSIADGVSSQHGGNAP